MLEKRKYRNYGKGKFKEWKAVSPSLGCPGMVVDITKESEGESHQLGLTFATLWM